MRYEGCQWPHVKKWGMFEDLEMYAILKTEYEPQSEAKYESEEMMQWGL